MALENLLRSRTGDVMLITYQWSGDINTKSCTITPPWSTAKVQYLEDLKNGYFNICWVDRGLS